MTPSGCKTIRAAIIAMTLDLPARALVLNMRQFNGLHGCHLCEDEGVTGCNNRLFRWSPYNSTSTLRTKSSLIENSIHATTHDEIVSKLVITQVWHLKFILVQRCKSC